MPTVETRPATLTDEKGSATVQSTATDSRALIRKGKCGASNCTHHYGSSSCTDVLLHPELLQDIQGYQSCSSRSPLLEFCLDGGHKPPLTPSPEVIPPILSLCSNSYLCETTYEMLRTLCQSGCDINVQNSHGSTPLHLLIQGCTLDSFALTVKCISVLLRHPHVKLGLRDLQGTTALLALHHLLPKGLHDEAFRLAHLLLQAGCDPNHFDLAGRTLLSYSVTFRDQSSDLTRMLLAHGARVFLPTKENHPDQSCFGWFLRAVMKTRSLGDLEETLYLLCHAMQAEEPLRMRQHVLSTMLHFGQTSAVFGPLFVDLKRVMAPYWNQPPQLKDLCLRKIRQSVGPARLAALELNLPFGLQQQL